MIRQHRSVLKKKTAQKHSAGIPSHSRSDRSFRFSNQVSSSGRDTTATNLLLPAQKSSTPTLQGQQIRLRFPINYHDLPGSFSKIPATGVTFRRRQKEPVRSLCILSRLLNLDARSCLLLPLLTLGLGGEGDGQFNNFSTYEHVSHHRRSTSVYASINHYSRACTIW